MLFLECVILSFHDLTYYMTFACNTFHEMLFPKLCTVSRAIDCLCDFLFIHPSVCLLRFALMGQNAVSVWRIHFKVVSLIHWDEETDTIFQTKIWSGFLGVNSFFHIFFFSNGLNKVSMYQFQNLVYRKLMTYRCAVHMKYL